jgi:putative oxidoreductase
MNSTLSLFAQGLNAPDAALAVVRVGAGTFFALSGYNKLFNKGRHQSLTNNLTKNGIPFIGFMQWWVPFWEFVAGTMLAIGLMSAFSSGVLMVICLVACCCEATKKVESYKPINTADRVDDYLYLPEVLYLFMLVITLFAGSGKYSVDALIF